MSEEMIVRHCSPTLAGLKTGNLFSCSYQDRGEILGFLREWNTKLRCKGVRLIPLRLADNKAACAKCVGCWKVYGDADKAQKQFERFKKCTRVYQKQYENGRPLIRLTVSR